MSKRAFKIRLYYPHDIDLISIYRIYKFNMVKAIYCSVTAFSKYDKFFINIPPLRETPLEKKKTYAFTLTLDSEKDAETLALIDLIDSGFRNNFFKNILRMYLIYPVTSVFVSTAEAMCEFDDRCMMFRYQQKCINLNKNDKSGRKKYTRKSKRNTCSTKKTIEQEKPVPASIPVQVLEDSTTTEEDKNIKTSSEEANDKELTMLFTNLITEV